MTVLQNHRTSRYFVFKRKSYNSSQARQWRVGFRSLHVSSEFTRLWRASLVL